MRSEKILALVSIILVLFLILAFKVTQRPIYEVEACNGELNKTMSVDYDEQNKSLTAYVWVNCCGVEVKVRKVATTYKILEKQYGTLCKSMCLRKVTIFNASKNYKVVFVNKDGEEFILTPVAGFCGWSTYGKCNSDEDCIRGGCSSQVCQSKYEEPVFTTCEVKGCYDAD